ncbi:BON domain-containing protein [Candidatus Vallotiella sp. (ex Adelges kitamiensis)]|uniref:BON domain-containing protein n=1 Tax=Candidatus Vallotiella sp. (ex Adelges kitamiensis) TaxID=2864217 RepID=UPI001CE31CC6|nr:BON domain-containing protein [Candidatus Vallotia sp. (ex Adelges kitamiensis)]
MINNHVYKTLMLSGLAATLALSLHGCGFLLLGAAASGTLMAVDRRTFGAQTEDREIQIKTLNQMRNSLPETAHVNVTVYNRRLLLTGEVPDEAVKQKVESIGRSISNVSSIANELVVEPVSSFSSRIRDIYISSKVQAALLGSKDISSNYYKWTTEHGTVYLMGLVTVREGNLGSEIVSQVAGVKRVVQLFQYVRFEDTKIPTSTAVYRITLMSKRTPKN